MAFALQLSNPLSGRLLENHGKEAGVFVKFCVSDQSIRASHAGCWGSSLCTTISA